MWQAGHILVHPDAVPQIRNEMQTFDPLATSNKDNGLDVLHYMPAIAANPNYRLQIQKAALEAAVIRQREDGVLEYGVEYAEA
jgi:hypothetical protein